MLTGRVPLVINSNVNSITQFGHSVVDRTLWQKNVCYNDNGANNLHAREQLMISNQREDIVGTRRIQPRDRKTKTRVVGVVLAGDIVWLVLTARAVVNRWCVHI